MYADGFLMESDKILYKKKQNFQNKFMAKVIDGLLIEKFVFIKNEKCWNIFHNILDFCFVFVLWFNVLFVCVNPLPNKRITLRAFQQTIQNKGTF